MRKDMRAWWVCSSLDERRSVLPGLVGIRIGLFGKAGLIRKEWSVLVVRSQDRAIHGVASAKEPAQGISIACHQRGAFRVVDIERANGGQVLPRLHRHAAGIFQELDHVHPESP